MKILILSALPQEYAPLKKLLRGWKKLGKKPFCKFALALDDKDILLIETGMGGGFARDALRAELLHGKPDLLIFAGFAGGLHADLPAGDVCFVRHTRMVSSQTVFQFHFPRRLREFLAEKDVEGVWAFTAHMPENKAALSALAAGGMAVVDMETALIAETALREKLPFLCFRAVSDAVGDKLGFDLREITDAKGRVKPTGVLKTVLTRPRTVKSFYLSWKRSSKAAKNLCEILAAFLRIPSALLREIAAQIRIESH